MSTLLVSTAVAATMTWGIVTQDNTALRAASKESSPQHAQLVQGELLEIRAERLDYVQVYDHRRERAGFVRTSQLRRTALTPDEAPEMLTLVKFMRDMPGSESLGIAYAAAYLKAAPASAVQGADGITALDALGTMAERLARRASPSTPVSKNAEALTANQLEAISRYGVQFKSYENEGRMQVCYEGDAFRRVLSGKASSEQKVRAALALTRNDCIDPSMRAGERVQYDQWRAEVLERADAQGLPAYMSNRLHMRRASVYSALAFHASRHEQMLDAQKLAIRALDELARVNKLELPEDDQGMHNDAVMRVNASRWAAVPMPTAEPKGLRFTMQRSETGQQCVHLVEGAGQKILAKRCTHGVVWLASGSINREQSAASIAVQPLEGWRELWLARKSSGEWSIDVLPPAPVTPETGYAEFAGWVPGGKQMLIAREARGEGKYRRSFEVMNLDSLSPERQNPDVSQLGAFSRWPDAQWKRLSVSVR
jgi:hypothetical protein